MSDSAAKTGQLHIALATWIFLLSDAGHPPDEAGLVDALQDFRGAPEDADHDALGHKLVAAVQASLGQGDDLGTVAAWLRRLYGADRITTMLGESRETRTLSARRYQFASNLPWLARIVDRLPDGSVGAHWVLVERVDEQVSCMDPYPWDDLDEQYAQPLVEFMVKWELAGCEGLRFKVSA